MSRIQGRRTTILCRSKEPARYQRRRGKRGLWKPFRWESVDRFKIEPLRRALYNGLPRLELGDELIVPPYTYRIPPGPVLLTLPLPPNPNSAELRGRHWSVRYRKKAGYFADCLVAMNEQGIRWPRAPWERARVDCYFLVRNVLDEDDNLPNRRKWILDFLSCETIYGGRLGLQKAPGTGFFRDDSPHNLDRGELSQAIDRANPRVELTIRKMR